MWTGTFWQVTTHDISGSAPTDAAGSDDRVVEIEQWLIERGVPHLVDPHTDSVLLDAWTRALPLLLVAYLVLGLNALDLQNWTLAENLAAAGAVVAMLMATWVISNRLRHRRAFTRPTQIGPPELVLFLVGPMLPNLAFGQFRDAAETFVLGVILLALIYVWSSYGIGALLRWGVRRSGGQLTGLGPLVVRALPLLLLFTTFLFINAEVWEMAGTLDGAAYVVVVLMFFGLGASFVLTRVPGFIRAENRFDSWEEIAGFVTGTPADAVSLPQGDTTADPLRPRQRFNIGLIVVFGQALQITLVVVAITGFFIFFGFMAITTETSLNWTGLDSLNIVADASFGGRTLVLSEPLIRVSVFLGAFSGMYFTVLLTTDDTYRSEFSDDIGPEIRQVLAVRCAYHVGRGTHPCLVEVIDEPAALP